MHVVVRVLSQLLSRSALVAAISAAVLATVLPPVAAARAAPVAEGFREDVVIDNLTAPTVIEFASDGRVVVAEKSGIIKVFDSLDDTSATVFADLRTRGQHDDRAGR